MNGGETPSHALKHEFDPLELSVILPAHNEVQLLPATVGKVLASLSARDAPFEIIVVENGSTDGTLRLARLLATQIPEVRVLTLPTGNYGAALRSGFEAARGEIVVNFDVDYCDMSFLEKAIELIETGNDIVLASKRAEGARDERSPLRRILTAGFSLALRSLLALEVSDTHGMKAMRRSHVSKIVDVCTTSGSIFDVELVLRSLQAGLEIAEVPAVVVELRPPRTSLINRTIETTVGLLRLKMNLRREQQSNNRTRAHTRARR